MNTRSPLRNGLEQFVRKPIVKGADGGGIALKRSFGEGIDLENGKLHTLLIRQSGVMFIHGFVPSVLAPLITQALAILSLCTW